MYYLIFLWQAEAQQSHSLLDLVLRASPIAKIVLLLLMLASILSWAIIVAKVFMLSKAQQQTKHFLDIFRRSGKLGEIYAACQPYRESPLAGLFLAGYQELDKQIQASGDGQNIKSLESVGRALQRASISETNRLESGVGWLASTANASPFIGLFGTVVGIIIAFEGLSAATQATIQAVAPGIAEALIATAAGIGAAVPAAIAYNHFLGRIKLLTSEMDDFSLEFINLIERNFT
ncbi:MAG: MotA/TolQ/ExbB proton channel family protein [Blastocatellia bacterium]|nr:MotA/TolQ/ExbB proton channel family protein [Blastocatellia bacterium]